MRLLISIFVFLSFWLLCSCSSEIEPKLGEPQDAQSLDRGRELVRGLGACAFCHGESAQVDAALVGGRMQYDDYGAVVAPNLTPADSGLKNWTSQEVIRALRSSIDKNGNELSTEVHKGLEWISDQDALAIASYLKTLPARERENERRHVSVIAKNTSGFFDSHKQLKGFVPAIEPKYVAEYGGYLVDHVARCISCHNGQGSLLKSEEYLAGGRTLRMDQSEKLVPGIGNTKIDGIGDWSEEDIVRYLNTSLTPAKRQIDSTWCPTGFYRNASPRDQAAIARYLKSLK